jgi:hypothetical protein
MTAAAVNSKLRDGGQERLSERSEFSEESDTESPLAPSGKAVCVRRHHQIRTAGADVLGRL